MESTIPDSLRFHGPFKFVKGDNFLFISDFANSEGVYLWIIRDEKHKQNLIEYVGQTPKFAARQKVHLLNILSLHYRIIDTKSAGRGKFKILWNDLWRDKSPEGVLSLLDKYSVLNKKVRRYVDLLDIFFAPIPKAGDKIRCAIEGTIGWNLRNKFPDKTIFYPADNHIGSSSTKYNRVITVTTDQPIQGIETQLVI